MVSLTFLDSFTSVIPSGREKTSEFVPSPLQVTDDVLCQPSSLLKYAVSSVSDREMSVLGIWGHPLIASVN